MIYCSSRPTEDVVKRLEIKLKDNTGNYDDSTTRESVYNSTHSCRENDVLILPSIVSKGVGLDRCVYNEVKQIADHDSLAL